MKALALFCFACLAMAARKLPPIKQVNNVEMAFTHWVDTSLLELNNTYRNHFKEDFTPKTLRYYISHIAFTDRQGKQYEIPDSCFLIDESIPESKNILLPLKPGKYVSVSFMIGIDSLRTINGVQEGPLDPYNGMFWTWNTGFVSAKFEGTSSVSRSPQKLFQYHIGGFRKGQNTLRTITIPFGKGLSFKQKKTTVRIQADLAKWFDAVNDLTISDHSFVHTPGQLAVQYADNYATMFRLQP